MKKISYILLTVILCIGCVPLAKAATELVTPYVCGFEQSEDLSDWVLNPFTPNAQDQWCIGEATHSEGERALYISANHGDNAAFGRSPNTVFAYRVFRYPHDSVTKRYDISFDWRCFGDPNKAKLRVWYGRKSLMQTAMLQYASETSGTTIPQMRLGQCAQITTDNQTTQELYNSEAWQLANMATNKVPVNMVDTEFVLLFAWTNECDDNDSILRVGGCVDNIQIVNADAPKPLNVSAEINCFDSSMLVTWESSLSNFVLAYKGNRDEGWHRIEGITNQVAEQGLGTEWRYRLPYMTEGVYELKLWAVKTYENSVRPDTSACVYLKDIISYCADNHCIDFIHLNAAGVVCTYGTYTDPYAHIGVVDYGSNEKESRHTIMSELNQFDPRTNGQLRTVPRDALASVRLGNWNNNYEAESITYEYVVDSVDNAILLMNYAVVLEDPQHAMVAQPFFSLTVKDENGDLIDGDECARVAYYAGHGSGVWNHCTWIERMPNGATDSHNMLWKDWSTVGLNLKKYHGKKVYVELLTKDCNEGMHFGYAYFTLDCSTARIRTNNCSAAAQAEATAPDGFDYEWRRVEDNSFYSNAQTIIVDASDTSPYACTCMSKENPDCSFRLQTYFQPQYPVAGFGNELIRTDCSVKLQMHDSSWVKYYEDGQEVRSKQKPQNYEWHIATSSGQKIESSTIAPMVSLNPNGDTVYVEQTVYLASRGCFDTQRDTLYVASIRTKDSVWVKNICQGDAVLFDDQFRDQTGTYYAQLTNQYGCDSIITLQLTVHPHSKDTTISDTVCSTMGYVFGGDTLRQSGPYEGAFLNRYGCDSLVHLNLEVQEQVEAQVSPIDLLCSDNRNMDISYQITQGAANYLQLSFDDRAHAASLRDTIIRNMNGVIHYPVSDSIRVGTYTAQLTFVQDYLCQSRTFTLPIEIRYSSSIIRQKWNDVLTVLNEKYNGGYQFTSYRWYRNGELLPNQHGSYIYLTDELGVGVEYYVELTRTDGVVMVTCPIITTRHTDITPFPTLVKKSSRARVMLRADAQIVFYTVQGLCYGACAFTSGYADVQMPDASGVYMVRIRYADQTEEINKVIVQ